MAGKVGSASFALYVDGYDLLIQKAKGFTWKASAVQENTTGLGDTKTAVTPVGLMKVEVSQSGAFFDDTANGVHALLSPAGATAVSRLMVAGYAGNIIGQPAFGASGIYGMSYEVLTQVAALTKANVTYDVSGTFEKGVVVDSARAHTADWNTSNELSLAITRSSTTATATTTPAHGYAVGSTAVVTVAGAVQTDYNGRFTATFTSATTFTYTVANSPTTPATGTITGGVTVDNGASTAFGAAGYLVVSAMSGFTGFVGKIRDSADDLTYADLITFTNVTAAPASQRVTNGVETVDRYVLFNGDTTGSGSINAFVVLARLTA